MAKKKTTSLNYTAPKLTSSQRAALAAKAGADTQLQYGDQTSSINSRTQLEAGQGRLIDSAYERYKQSVIDSEVRRKAAAQAGATEATKLAGMVSEGIAGVGSQQAGQNDATNAITGGTVSSGDAFQKAMATSLGQQVVDNQGAADAEGKAQSDYSGSLETQAAGNKEYYRQKSTDRLAGLGKEQTELSATIGKAKKGRLDDLIKQKFDEWAATEKVKLGNRSVNVDRLTAAAANASRESIAEANNATSIAVANIGADAKNNGGLSKSDKASLKALDNGVKSDRTAMYAAVNNQANWTNGKVNWSKVQKATGNKDGAQWTLLKDLTYPGLDKKLSSAGYAAAVKIYGKYGVPKWLKDMRG